MTDGNRQPSIAAVRALTLAEPGIPFDLNAAPTRDDALFPRKHDALASLKDDTRAIDRLQDTLYAERARSLLVVLQGIDCAGKSGVTKSAFERTSPMGMQVTAFKAPTRHERARDYLWRVHAAAPKKGFIGIFDRSHYEDVLVVRVRHLAPLDEVEQRYEQINQFEKHLIQNGTKVLKIMLNLSRLEQGDRLADRLETAHKRWKFNPADLEDRAFWTEYMEAYEIMLNRCSTEHAPWHVVPADSKSRRNAICARLIRGALEDMAPQYPDPGYRLADFDVS
jgi:PPK2 family polyphosphate:nucleotide phosphotransferase